MVFSIMDIGAQGLYIGDTAGPDDPLAHLSYVAAVTSSLELATGIVILPQRNPLVLAEQVASLDLLRSGRFTLGTGAGYVPQER
ncbi:LLM class flavin-dependent oxidoreductase [Lentzea albidocapillata]|uniref:Luciferase-like monooxygenase n=1 Tax=Lentzea albidocapillata TaxID=40571 RepID=A0A1W2EB06_9PSEU|nr:LLM class flavin-dependent oxidoreductase [Lentzea albidocapillata]SMD06526.1 Luciferase-like monooxygenase [Lentzea albidocapillata]